MNSLASALAFSMPRGSGQTPISPLAMQLAQQPTTHWAELLGKLAMVGVDNWSRSRQTEKQANSIADLLAGPAGSSQTAAAASMAPGMGGAVQASPAGQNRDQIASLLMDNPNLAPFFQSAALAQQFPEIFGDPAAQGGEPEFKVIGNNAAWVDPATRQVEWVLGGPPQQVASGSGGGAAPTMAPAQGGPPAAGPTLGGGASAPEPPPAGGRQTTAAPVGKPLNETQSKASEFSSYIARGGDVIDALTDGGFRPSMMTMLAEPSQDFFGMVANQVLSPEEQQFWQAVNEITAGVLRRETGAAFGADEVRRVMSRVIPLPNDDDATLALKRETRLGIMNEMRRSAGLPPIEPGGGAPAPAPAPAQQQAPSGGGAQMIAPSYDPSGLPNGATYEGPEGKFVVQDGQWWQVE